MEKFAKATTKLWPVLAGAVGLPVGMDVMQHDDFSLGSFDKKRIGNAFLNALIGAGSGHLIHKGLQPGQASDFVAGVSLAPSALAKDLLLNAQDTPMKVNKAMDNLSTDIKLNRALTGALGVGALGLGTLGILKYLTTKNPKTEMGSLKIKLPGKKGEPGTDAEVNLPIDMPQMSPSLMEGLNRGVRMQARKNVKANSFKRDPETGKNIPIEEWEAKYKDMINSQGGLPKVASTREWAEGAGSVTSGALSAIIGAVLGGSMSKENPALGALAGAGLAAITPSVAGSLFASLAGPRKDTDQFKHDQHNALAEYIVPGYATYQHERRLNQEEDKNKLSFANTLASDAAFSPEQDDYDDDMEYFGKEASTPMQPAPQVGAPQGTPQGPPPPADPKRTRQVATTETPAPAQQARERATMNAGSLRNKVNRATASLNTALKSPVKTAAYTIELYTYPEAGVKQAAAMDMSAREEARGIMKRIYDEDPSYWPYGLDIPGHESLYIIRDNMTKAAAGFVGWQEMVERGRKIGSYSIGILPEYRNKGFAKEAVAKVLQIKSAGVDEVRAYIMKHNGPSHALADSLGVKIQEKF